MCLFHFFTHPYHDSLLAYVELPSLKKAIFMSKFTLWQICSSLHSVKSSPSHWQFHIPPCKNRHNVSTFPHSAIRHNPIGFRRIYKSVPWDHKSPGSDPFRPHSRSNRQHYILLGAEIQLHTGKFADFLASCYCTSYIYVWFYSGFLPIFSSSKCTFWTIFSDILHL